MERKGGTDTNGREWKEIMGGKKGNDFDVPTQAVYVSNGASSSSYVSSSSTVKEYTYCYLYCTIANSSMTM